MEKMSQIGNSNIVIVKTIGRNKSIIGGELSRNRSQRGYRNKAAHRLAMERRIEKSEVKFDGPMVERVEEKLREKWRPEQIAGRFKSVSHQRIYEHVREDKTNAGDLNKSLKRENMKRRKRYGSKDASGKINDRIDQSPKVVDGMTRIGDWKSDTIVGDERKGLVVTLVERKSKYSLISKVDKADAETVANTVIDIGNPHKDGFQTITYGKLKKFRVALEGLIRGMRYLLAVLVLSLVSGEMAAAAKTAADALVPKPHEVVFTDGETYELPNAIGVSNAFDDARVRAQIKRTFAGREIVAGAFLRLEKAPRAKGDEAYELKIAPDGIDVKASSPNGAFYALKTLEQLARGRSALPRGTIRDWPDLKFRGVHIMTGWRCVPTIDALKLMIAAMSDLKQNKLVLEYDEQLPNWRHGGMPPYTVEQIHDLAAFGRDHFIEIIPLIDSLGHMFPYLRPEEYARLREQPDKISELCPQNPESLEFVKKLWGNALLAHPEKGYAHISGDEVFQVKPCPKCRPFRDQNRQGELYREYYTKLSRWMIEQGKQPIIWGDMLIKKPEALKDFPRDIVICYWDYTGAAGDLSSPYMRHVDGRNEEVLFAPYWKPNKNGAYDPFPYLKFFGDQGFKTIAASTAVYSQNKDQWPASVSPISFYNNARFSLEARKREKTCLGLLCTTWCYVIPGFWFGAVAAGDASWNAQPETFEEYVRRFATGFLRRPDWAAPILQMAKAQEGQSATVPELNGEPGVGADAMALEFTQFLKFTADYMRFVMAQRADNSQIFRNEVKGTPKPLEMTRVVGSGALKNALPAQGRRFTANSGDYDFYGLPLRLDDQHVIRLRSSAPKRVTVPIKQKLSGLLFWTTAYNAWPDNILVEMKVNYEDAADEKFAFVGDHNVLDWTAAHKTPKDKKSCVIAWRGRKDTSEAICSWLTYWRNPRPDKLLDKFTLSAVPGDGKKETFVVFLGISALEETPFPSAESAATSAPVTASKETLRTLEGRAEALFAKWVKPAYLKRTVGYQFSNLRERMP